MGRYKHSDLAFEVQVLDALATALTGALGSEAKIKAVPGLDDFSNAEPGPDGLIEILTPGKILVVYVEIKRNVYPRDIRDAGWKLDRYMHSRSHAHGAIGMVAATSLSPGAKQDLIARNIAFFELGGSLYLKHDYWFVNIEKAPKRAQKTSQGVELFTESRESVIHALLMNGNGWVTGTELAEQADTSEYTCSLVLKELTLREWVESAGGGPSKRRTLVQPQKLLDAWAEHRRNRKDSQTRGYTFVENPKQLLSDLAKRIDRSGVDFPWAFTGTAAANVIAPLLTNADGAEIVLPKGYVDHMVDALGLKPANKGANVTLIEREAASLLYRYKPPGHLGFFASSYILYLDLLNGRGRNKELADHLRKRLEALW